jgi:colanic acid biosynthesis glycosyl transferase WcaI
MNILIVSQYFWPENFRINDLVRGLMDRGHGVSVLTGQPTYNINPGSVGGEDLSDYHGAPVVRVPMIGRGAGKLRLMLNYLCFFLSASTIGLWKLRGRKFDVIFAPQLSPVTAILPAIVIRAFWRRKLAIWVLDLWPDTLQALEVVTSPRILGWVGALVRFIYHRCDLIFVQSKSFVTKVQTQAKKPVTVEYLPSWSEVIADPATVDYAPEVARKPGMFTIVFAGNIGATQDFPSVVEAMTILRSVPKLRWVIVGEGRAADWLRSECASRALGNVEMVGAYPLDRMPSFFKHADALLVPLKAEPIFAMTIPGKVQTYLASGKPILAMLDGEGAQVIRESGAGFACGAGNAQGLADAVTAMMALDPEARVAMGRAGQDYCVRTFDRATLIDQVEQRLLGLSNKDKRV